MAELLANVKLYRNPSKEVVNGKEELKDKNEMEMAEYLKEHGHWLYVPHGDILTKEFKVKYGVRGLPSLVILRENGKIVSLEGAEEVQSCFSILDEKKADALLTNWHGGTSPN